MASSRKWEYKSVKFEAKGWLGGVADVQALDASLNGLGQQGWELVAVFDTNMAQGVSREVVATLKREVIG